MEAFAARWQSLRLAGRSLDLQYYYWKGDLTGRLLCLGLIEAADRGVRVRLLLDDINNYGFDKTYLALDSHPNIHVRLFNPSRSREDAFRRGIELIVKYFTATRRMHNKCWIADGRIVIAGGRNIGDEYFDASDAANFQDIDVLATGKAVDGAEAIFDRYWNSDAALPIRQLHRIRRPKLAKLRLKLTTYCRSSRATRFLSMAGCVPGDAPSVLPLSELHWSSDTKMIADPPEKASGEAKDEWMGEQINDLIKTAQKSLSIISPYFIPGETGARTMTELAAKGVHIRVLTNSLAATDVIAVHGAYARYRKWLVSNSVKLFELKPEPGRHRASLFGSTTASLHTKALVVDGKVGFIGSFNLDPRSRSINTEMGILFRCPVLARQLQDIFETQILPEISYSVSDDGGALRWVDEHKGATRHHTGEPDAPLRRIIPAAVIAWLPIESQL
jgi:putative cardiolipin synthase